MAEMETINLVCTIDATLSGFVLHLLYTIQHVSLARFDNSRGLPFLGESAPPFTVEVNRF